MTSTPRSRAAFDHRHDLRGLAPHADGPQLDVGDLHRQPAPARQSRSPRARPRASCRLRRGCARCRSRRTSPRPARARRPPRSRRSCRLRTRDRTTARSRRPSSPARRAPACARSLPPWPPAGSRRPSPAAGSWRGRRARRRSPPPAWCAAWPGSRGSATASCRPVRASTVVMPCETCVIASGSLSSPSVEWLCMSMNPGASTRPVASSTRSSGGGVIAPMLRMVSPSMRTSTRRSGPPLPSATWAPTIVQVVVCFRAGM